MDRWIMSVLGWSGLKDSSGTSIGRYRLTFADLGITDVMSKVAGFLSSIAWVLAMLAGTLAVQMLGIITDPQWLNWLSEKYRQLTELMFREVPPMLVAAIAAFILIAILAFKPTMSSSRSLSHEDRSRIAAAVVLFFATAILAGNPFLILDTVMSFTSDMSTGLISAMFGDDASAKAPLVDTILRDNTTLISYGQVLTGDCAQAWSHYISGGSKDACLTALEGKPSEGTVIVAAAVLVTSWVWIVFALVCCWKFVKHMTVGVIGIVAIPFYCAGSIVKRRPLDGVGAVLARSLGHLVVAVVIQSFVVLWGTGVSAMVASLKAPGILAVWLTMIGYLVGTAIVLWMTRKNGFLIKTLRATSDGMPVAGSVKDGVYGAARNARRSVSEYRAHRDRRNMREIHEAVGAGRRAAGALLIRSASGATNQEGAMTAYDSSTPPPLFRDTKMDTPGRKPVAGAAATPWTHKLFPWGRRPAESAATENAPQQNAGAGTDNAMMRGAKAPAATAPQTSAGRHAAPVTLPPPPGAPAPSPLVRLPNGAVFDLRADGPPTRENVTRMLSESEATSGRTMFGGRTPNRGKMIADMAAQAVTAVQARAEEIAAAQQAAPSPPVAAPSAQAVTQPASQHVSGAQRAADARNAPVSAMSFGPRTAATAPGTPAAPVDDTPAILRLGDRGLSSGAQLPGEPQVVIRSARLRRPTPSRPADAMRGAAATRGDVRATQGGQNILGAAEASRDRRATAWRRRARGQSYLVSNAGDQRSRMLFTPDRAGSKVTTSTGVGFGDRTR